MSHFQIPHVVVIGSINMDLVIRSTGLPRPGETIIGRQIQEVPGGKGANQAVAAARFGARVLMVGRVGDDSFGLQLRARLQENCIDATRVATTSNCSSGVAIVSVDDSGENAITVIPGEDKKTELIPAFEIDAVDTTAAGDGFAAAVGFLLAFHNSTSRSGHLAFDKGETIRGAVQMGCAAGAIVASRPGAQPAMPTLLEVAEMMGAQYTESLPKLNHDPPQPRSAPA